MASDPAFRNLPPEPPPRVEPPLPTAQPLVEARIIDVQIPFGSMVILLVKLALAAIPAIIILAILGLVLSAVIAGVFGVGHLHQ